MLNSLFQWFHSHANQGARRVLASIAVVVLLAGMGILAGGAALRQSATFDEVAHVGAGVSYLQTFEIRLNGEHPPLAKVLAALPLVLRGVRADYSHISWTFSESFFPAFMCEWVFGDWLLTRWNDPVTTLAWARLPILLLTLVLGWVVFSYARTLGGLSGGLLCLSVYVSTPLFLTFGPLVLTDLAITLFAVITLWTLARTWQEPSRRNVTAFALSLAGALLSKFTAGVLFFAMAAFALSMRWRPVAGQPEAKPEARAWRRGRWRATLRGIVLAALVVYAFYFVFSWNQSTAAVDRLPALEPLRRLVMPAWLYLRGVLFVSVTLSRPTFILGHAYPHGVWFYYPVVLSLKSTLGFLGLIVLTLVAALVQKRYDRKTHPVVSAEARLPWRVVWISFVLFTGLCLMSRLNMSIRHLSIPVALLILLLAPLPRMLERLRSRVPITGRLATGLTVALALSSVVTMARTYPFFFPYVNALSLGHPVYALLNDSNVDWNQALPEVRRFSERHGQARIFVDMYGFADPTAIVPQSEIWNCQKPTGAEAGQFVFVSANMIMDNHNCAWLLEYPHEPLGGGSMYAVRLPDPIPAAGVAGGPPPASEHREFSGMPVDVRPMALELIRHPDRLPRIFEDLQKRFGPPSEEDLR
jgi:4-amino-4-deoxy-L-arabinose transferase-like glycosyltransferase